MANLLSRVKDGLINAVSGIGTRGDPRSHTGFCYSKLTQVDIQNAYLGSGMMRKCIDIPALDMVRAWRQWKADDIDIEQLEAEEKRLGLLQKIYEAEILRGLGGAAIIIGAPGIPSEPMPDIKKGGIAFLHLVSRYQITLGEIDGDPMSPNYGLPSYFIVNDAGQTKIHPSRVVAFTGEIIPKLINTNLEDDFWGESRVQRLMSAVKNTDTAQDSFAALLHKARVTRIGIPDLTTLVGDVDGEAAIQKRLSAMAIGESIHNSSIYDSGNGSNNPGESITDFQVSWTGMDAVMMAFDKRLCAVADIPATRLLGESPGGLNASGGGQQQDWHKHISAMQELRLSPCIDKLDLALIPSATGKAADKSVWYKWAALDVPDAKTLAETNKINIESAVKAQETGSIPDSAFSQGFQSMLVESGIMPALETALELIPESERFGIVQEGPDGTDPNALTKEPEV